MQRRITINYSHMNVLNECILVGLNVCFLKLEKWGVVQMSNERMNYVHEAI